LLNNEAQDGAGTLLSLDLDPLLKPLRDF
jgi:hypothetical protein